MEKQERVGLLYVCGFMFSPNKDQVLLINKTHPDWQNEKMNGLGGKVQNGETPIMAMQRTFEAQTGVKTSDDQWRDFSTHSWQGAENKYGLLIFFETTAMDMKQFADCKNITDEMLAVIPVVHLPIMEHALPDIKWLVPLALDPTRRLTMSFSSALMTEDKDLRDIVRQVWYDPRLEMPQGAEENSAGEQKKSGEAGENEGEGLKEKMEFTASQENDQPTHLEANAAGNETTAMESTSEPMASAQESASEATAIETKAAGIDKGVEGTNAGNGA